MDLFGTLYNWDACASIFEKIKQSLKDADPTISVLALEGLYRIEYDDIRRGQFSGSGIFKNFLGDWRCMAPIMLPYSVPIVPAVLHHLIIFRKLEVPLFVASCGKKLLLSEFENDLEDIKTDELVCIKSNSDDFLKRDITKERWYEVVTHCNTGQNDDNNDSCGDGKGLSLLELGVKGLQQGEIIYYEDKVNVIFYAINVDDRSTITLKKPTLAGVQKKYNNDCQIKVWIAIECLFQQFEINDELCAPPDDKKVKLHHDELSSGASSKFDEDSKTLDLVQAFVCPGSCRIFLDLFVKELEKIEDPAIPLLAMEGLYRLEKNVNRVLGQIKFKNHQLPLTSDQYPCIKEMQKFLHHWRQTSLSECFYKSKFFGTNYSIKFLRSLTIFKTLDVPLFIDDHGSARLMKSFPSEELETIRIDKRMPIIHVTHRKEAKGIADQNKFIPQDNKNSVKGVWFGLDDSERSVYGSKGFKTTLSQLGVTGLYQGEIVYYKQERNFILYATDDEDASFEGLKKQKQSFIEREEDGAYAKISIFVPSRFLPSEDEFWNVVNEFVMVDHGPFCLQVKRKTRDWCPELAKTW